MCLSSVVLPLPLGATRPYLRGLRRRPVALGGLLVASKLLGTEGREDRGALPLPRAAAVSTGSRVPMARAKREPRVHLVGVRARA